MTGPGIPCAAALACLASLTLPSAAQELRWPEPIAPEAWAAGGVEVVRGADQLVARVEVWSEGEQVLNLPLVPPRADVAVGMCDEVMVLLAGGVRESLDLYLAVPRTGELRRYATDDGRLLPRDFNQGRGSWPLVQGRDVVVFAYQRHGHVEVRALGFGEQVFGSRAVPASTLQGLQVSSDQRTHEVRVTASGEAGEVLLTFRHPRAPRLDVLTPLLDYGAVAVGEGRSARLEIANSGGRPLDLVIGAPSPGFALAGPSRLRLQPGERLVRDVAFSPREVREHRGRLDLSSPGLPHPVVVVLRGLGVDPAAAPQPAETQGAPPAPTSPPPTADEPPPAEPTPSRPVVEPAPAVDPDRFEQVPTLGSIGDVITVRGRPRALLLLAQVAIADGGTAAPRVLLPLRTWHLVLDAGGEQAVPLRQLGIIGGPVHLTALDLGARAPRHAPVLTIR